MTNEELEKIKKRGYELKEEINTALICKNYKRVRDLSKELSSLIKKLEKASKKK